MVSLNFSRWDWHGGNFKRGREDMPMLDRAVTALVEDLELRGMLDDVSIVVWGEFGRTPRINARAGRDHWARSWSAVLGGGPIVGGMPVGATSGDGSEVESEPYSAQDLMATVCQALGISLQTTFKSRSGRPMKIANGGKVIPGVVGT